MDNVKKFGERLFKLREERGETQLQLAQAIGITRQSLSRYETNERTPNIDLIYSIAKHFNVSTDYLLGLSDVQSVNTDIQTACKVTGLSETSVKALKEFYIERKKNKDPDEYTSTDSINTLLKAVLSNKKTLEYITKILNTDYDLLDMCSNAETQKQVAEINETNIKFKVLSYPEYLEFCKNTAKNELNEVVDMIVYERFGDLPHLKERELNGKCDTENE